MSLISCPLCLLLITSQWVYDSSICFSFNDVVHIVSLVLGLGYYGLLRLFVALTLGGEETKRKEKEGQKSKRHKNFTKNLTFVDVTSWVDNKVMLVVSSDVN